jgi:DNA primase catalytic subunit
MVSEFLKYYSRKDIQENIVNNCEDRELAAKLGDKGFSKRPNILQYNNEILDFVKNGATSFHISEEHWKDPLMLKPGMNKQRLDELRKGWDLILDIDSPELEDSKIITHYLVEALKFNDVKNIFVKYSGNKGFHIAVPFESFPGEINGILTKNLFPDGPKTITLYLMDMIKIPLRKEFGDRLGEVFKVDTGLISNRHMYRAPYSLHEKTGLVSVPVNNSEILKFNKADALPDRVLTNLKFLDSEISIKGDAKKLILQAFDWNSRNIRMKTQIVPKREYRELDEEIISAAFPPCIKKGLRGMEDGKKRFLFILINFLKNTGYSFDKLEEVVREWNKKNPEQLKEGYILSQLSWHKRQSEKVLPPNCPHASQNPEVNYYNDLGLCNPDNLCMKGKNPTNYAIRKSIILKNTNKSKLYKQSKKTKSHGKNKDYNGEEYNFETIQGKSRKI